MPELRADFFGVRVMIEVPARADLEHLEYYLRDHLTPPGPADLHVRLETDGGGSFVAAIATPALKRTSWRPEGGTWRGYEKFGVRARRLSLVPPFGIPPLADRFRIRHGAAAAVPDGSGRALAITGDSGCGKSVLLLALLRTGWWFVSDDVLVLDRDGIGLHYYGRPVGVRVVSRPLFPWLADADLQAAPCLDTELGGTWMVRPERLGRCLGAGAVVRLRRRVHLTPAARFDLRTEGRTVTIGWDPQRHLEVALRACTALFEGSSSDAA